MVDKEKMKEFEELVKPLNKWLQENYTPHHQIIIRNDGAEIVQGITGIICKVLD